MIWSDMRLIVGQKCLTCPDYDICASCFSITPDEHPYHSFVKVTNANDIVVSFHTATSQLSS